MNQRQLSKNADIPPTTISGWLNADRVPDYHALKKLAIFFDVSADYLLELEDEHGAKIQEYCNNHINVKGNHNNVQIGNNNNRR